MSEDRIIAYLEGELTPDAARAFERELDADPALLAEVEAWRQTLEAARDWAVADAPGVERADALPVPVDDPPPAKVVAVRPRRLVWQAAAAAAIFIAGVWVGGNTQQPDTPDEPVGKAPLLEVKHVSPPPPTPKQPATIETGGQDSFTNDKADAIGAPFIAAVSTRYAKDERGRLTIETTHPTGARALWVVDGGFQIAQTSFGRE